MECCSLNGHNRDELVRLFNEICLLDEHTRSPKKLLMQYAYYRNASDVTKCALENLIYAMKQARKEIKASSNDRERNRAYQARLGTTWLHYVTFRRERSANETVGRKFFSDSFQQVFTRR